jgi:hypothetical protein
VNGLEESFHDVLMVYCAIADSSSARFRFSRYDSKMKVVMIVVLCIGLFLPLLATSQMESLGPSDTFRAAQLTKKEVEELVSQIQDSAFDTADDWQRSQRELDRGAIATFHRTLQRRRILLASSRRNPSSLKHLSLSLLKEFFIRFLYVQRLFDAAAYVVTDHQARKFVAIHQHNALTQMFCCFLRSRRKDEVVTKRPFVALCRSKLPKKSRIAPGPMLLPDAYRFACM